MTKPAHGLEYNDHCEGLNNGLANTMRLLTGAKLTPAEIAEAEIFIASVGRMMAIRAPFPGQRGEGMSLLAGCRHEIMVRRAAVAEAVPPMAA